MNTPLQPDRRTFSSSIVFHGEEIPFTVNFYKDRLGITTEKRGNSYALKAQVGTPLDQVKGYLLNYLQDTRSPSPPLPIQNSPPCIQGTFTVRDMKIPYFVIVKGKRQVPLYTMYKDGRLELTVSAPVSQEEAMRLLKQEENWIVREYYMTRSDRLPQEEDKSVIVFGREVPYRLRRSPRAKRMSIMIHYSGMVEVVVPYDTHGDIVEAFVADQAERIAPKIGITPQVLEHGKRREAATDAPGTGIIEYNGHQIPYSIRRSTKAKRIIIKVDRERNVVMVSPPHSSLSAIHAVAVQHAGWVYKHTIESKLELPPERTYTDGEVWPWFGGEVVLRITEGEQADVKLVRDELMVTVPAGYTEYYKKKSIQELLELFFARSIHTWTQPYFRRYAELLSVSVPTVKVRNQKTKWGVCTPNGIILNLRLCMASPKVIEYVVAHELCHKIHPNHSSRFWNELKRVMPDCLIRREELKKQGYMLRI